MTSSSQYAAACIREFSDLAERLAAHNIVIATLNYDFACFGNWHLFLEKDHVAIRCFWDGKDGDIYVESSPIRGNNTPKEWKQEISKRIDRR